MRPLGLLSFGPLAIVFGWVPLPLHAEDGGEQPVSRLAVRSVRVVDVVDGAASGVSNLAEAATNPAQVVREASSTAVGVGTAVVREATNVVKDPISLVREPLDSLSDAIGPDDNEDQVTDVATRLPKSLDHVTEGNKAVTRAEEKATIQAVRSAERLQKLNDRLMKRASGETKPPFWRRLFAPGD